MFDLSGRVAVVTGASRGLGREDALTLARMGADVVITDILIEDDPNLQSTAEGANSILAQVATSQGWVYSNATAEEIRQMGRRATAIKMDVTDRERIREVFAQVKEQFGRIDILINNAATKAGVIGLARTAALEGGRHGITANAIAPGIILSEAGRAAAQTNPLYERFKNRTVFKRFGEPSDIAATIGFLCSEEAGYITGAAIEVAGGIPLFTA